MRLDLPAAICFFSMSLVWSGGAVSQELRCATGCLNEGVAAHCQGPVVGSGVWEVYKSEEIADAFNCRDFRQRLFVVSGGRCENGLDTVTHEQSYCTEGSACQPL